MVQQISNKIKIVSFLATVFVVYRHSLNYLAFFGTWEGYGYNAFIQNGFMTLTQIAVPLFFIVSGFFFFKRNYYDGLNLKKKSKSAWCKMVRVKFKTLFIPFTFWNVFGLLVLIVTKQGYKIDIFSFLKSDWYGPLWYVRDLMVLMLIVPLYQWIFSMNAFKNYKYISGIRYILPLVVLGILYYLWIPIDTNFLSSEGILFFFLGGLLRKSEVLLSKHLSVRAFVILSIIWLLWSFAIIKVNSFHGIYILVGIVLLWNLIDFFPSRIFNMFLKYGDYSFLIYVTHFYLIKAFKVALGKMFYGDAFISMLSYLCLPLLCVAMIIFVGKIIQRFFPNIYAFTMGGRV